MAARQATNRQEFVDASQRQGTPVSILTGEQEAELGFHSAADDPVFRNEPRLTIIDVGGQSTELVTAERADDAWNLLFRRSFPVGTLGLRGAMLSAESPDAPGLLAAIRSIDETIGLCYLPGQTGKAVALGATGTNLISIREKMTQWDPARVHGSWLDYEEVSKAAGWLSRLTDEQRRAVPGMEPGRERTIHIGALILERFLFVTRSLGCYVSVKGWRHALMERGLPQEAHDR
jgi:exopolyphosphatase/guanosine-5'-triphosphate,3'-diphosphate pyrophosphatase